MPDFGVVAGDTNVTIYVRLRDSTTGLAKTGLLFNSAGAVCSYVLPGAARAAITLATQTVTGAHSDGGFVEVDATNCKGLYRLDLPDAAVASGAYSLISIEFDGIIEETVIVPLSNTPQTGDSFARLGAPAGASVSADIAVVDGNVDAILVDTAEIGVAGAGLTEAGGTGDQFTALPDVTLADGVTHGGTSARLTLGNSTTSESALTITNSASLGQAVQISDSGLTSSRAITASSMSGSIFSTALATALLDASGIRTAVGLAAANLDTQLGDIPTVSEFNARTLAAADYFDPAADAVANVTTVGTLTGHTAQTGDTYALANGSAGFVAIDTVVDAIKVITDALGATAAARLALSAGQIIPGTVDTVTNTHTPTTTVFQADDITEGTADHFNGRIVIFTSGALAGQATDITDYAAVGGIGQLTVTAMTEAPANDDTFIIV